MHTVFEIADWFLSKEKMTHKKLQKLCYYTTAWSYAILPEPICDASFEAWVHGPVCRELYQKYKMYGFGYIPQGESNSVFNSNEEDFLGSVWMTYGDMSATALEIQTHSELPWKSARVGLADNIHCEKIIDPLVMREFYRSVYIGGDA